MTKLHLYIVSGLISAFLFGCQNDTESQLFTSVDPLISQVNFSNEIVESEDFNINEYMYAHDGGGVALGDVNNDGLTDIYFTANQLSNRLFINKGDFVFEDVTEQAGVSGLVGPEYWTTGVVMADINHDGWLDIYINQVSGFKNFKGRNQLLINNGDGTFTEQGIVFGLDLKGFGQQAVFFDYDLDGDLDMYQLNHSLHELDVFVHAEKRALSDSLAGDKLMRNDEEFFVDVTAEAGLYSGPTGYGLSVGAGDFDNNGCPDLFVSNDFHENDFIYFNQCDGTFIENSGSALGHTSTFSMGSDIADINEDGLLDLMTLDMKSEDEIIRKSTSGVDPFEVYFYKLSFGYQHQFSRNMLQINQGNLTGDFVQFSEVGQMLGIDATDWSWSVLLNDYDNDGDRDIFITNGIPRSPIDLDYLDFIRRQRLTKNMSSLKMTELMPEGKAINYAFRNNGQLVFENVSSIWGLDLEGCSMGSAYADLDNDGDLDLVVNNLNEICSIYRNNAEHTTGNNYLKVELIGNEKNQVGIGARVEIKYDGKSDMQELYTARGWLSSSEPHLNFGLGKVDMVDTVQVTWFDGKQSIISNFQANQHIKIKYDEAGNKKSYQVSEKKLFEEAVISKLSTYTHQENDFTDFEIERLIPHKLSTEGPKVVVEDFNSDGMEDVFICGAHGQPSAIFIQEIRDGEIYLIKQDIQVLIDDADKEDIDAVFFDADNDGDKDLYVVSGGGQFPKGPKNQDRLYINNGGFSFEKTVQFPEVNTNGSCVVAEDFDKDGFVDLFVGSRSVFGRYGESSQSYVLWNDGSGGFIKDTANETLNAFGMVTDAVWNSEKKELIVVGEWMPVTFVKFQGREISIEEMPNSSGWWNTIYPVDINHDNHIDYALGNLGLNSELKTSIDHPVKLLIKDWDNNNQLDPLITHFRQGKEWLLFGLNDLEKQMPPISIRYKSHKLYASHTLDQVFSENDLTNIPIKKAVTFNSVLLVNQGNDFQMVGLPVQMQTAPIYSFYANDFNNDGYMDLLAGGNFYGNTPLIGKLDASYGHFLLGNEDGSLSYIEPKRSGFAVQGEVRDIQSIIVGDENHILVARNNNELKIFKLKNQFK